MPTPQRTSLPEIVREGRRILEAEGLEQLTMIRLAHAVGVRAPSLYKHVRDRGDLIRLIGNDAVSELGARLAAAGGSGDARQDLRAMTRAHRVFAHEFPETYRLLWSGLPERWRFDAELNVRASEPVLRTIAALAGEEETLVAARTYVAWAHGFVSMELAGAFRLGGDVDAAFDYGLEILPVALSREEPSPIQDPSPRSSPVMPRRAGYRSSRKRGPAT
jgi:AcrR family transcriptional regulator